MNFTGVTVQSTILYDALTPIAPTRSLHTLHDVPPIIAARFSPSLAIRLAGIEAAFFTSTFSSTIVGFYTIVATYLTLFGTRTALLVGLLFVCPTDTTQSLW